MKKDTLSTTEEAAAAFRRMRERAKALSCGTLDWETIRADRDVGKKPGDEKPDREHP